MFERLRVGPALCRVSEDPTLFTTTVSRCLTASTNCCHSTDWNHAMSKGRTIESFSMSSWMKPATAGLVSIQGKGSAVQGLEGPEGVQWVKLDIQTFYRFRILEMYKKEAQKPDAKRGNEF